MFLMTLITAVLGNQTEVDAEVLARFLNALYNILTFMVIIGCIALMFPLFQMRVSGVLWLSHL